jgi:hypothetical protein
MNASSLVRCALALVLLAGVSSSHSAPPAGGSQCRFYSASDVSAALGRKMNITIDNDQQCVYRDASDANKTLVVQVHARKHEPGEMKIIRKTGEKLPAAEGEAYFDADLFGFAALVAGYHVSVQTTIQPMPRKELIAIGTRITQTLASR